MESKVNALGPKNAGSSAPAQHAGWLGSLFLGIALLAVYLINGRELGCDDTFSANLIPLNILRGHGISFEAMHLADSPRG